ncbi:MAG: site-specific integrase [Gemmatales bacterium]|nr:tyrosine-type recombinase/integrase [Gemmatales bacterium]MDW8175403.1 site-specific integrase [Gemmatales bacterium]
MGSSKALSEHLADYIATLRAKGRSEDHIQRTEARVRYILDHCHFRLTSELDANQVLKFLSDEAARQNLAATTLNNYLTAIKMFTNWLYRRGIIPRNPLDELGRWNAATDRRHIRRAPSAEEVRRLLASTLQGPKRFGLTGVELYRLYLLAAWTGLRASEIRRLRVADLILDGTPRLRIRAEATKNRRETELPLRAELVEALREQVASKLPEAPLFRLPSPGNVSKMLRADLEQAGVVYKNELGVFDFHAFRVFYTTALASSGLPVKTVQELARHADPTMTLGVYTKVYLPSLTEAVNRLPDLVPRTESAQVAQTGTEGQAIGLHKVAPVSQPTSERTGLENQCEVRVGGLHKGLHKLCTKKENLVDKNRLYEIATGEISNSEITSEKSVFSERSCDDPTKLPTQESNYSNQNHDQLAKFGSLREPRGTR